MAMTHPSRQRIDVFRSLTWTEELPARSLYPAGRLGPGRSRRRTRRFPRVREKCRG